MTAFVSSYTCVYSLPIVLWKQIFNYLSFKDQSSAARVSKAFLYLINSLPTSGAAHNARLFSFFGLVEPAVREFKGHAKKIEFVSVCANSAIITSSEDCFIKIWDKNTGRLIFTLNEQDSHIVSSAVYEGELITSSKGGTIKIWDLTSFSLLHTEELERKSEDSNDDFALTVYEKKIIACSLKVIKIWDLATRKLLLSIDDLDFGETTSFFIEQGKLLLRLNKSIQVRDFASGKLLYELQSRRIDPWIISLKHIGLQPLIYEGKLIFFNDRKCFQVNNFDSGELLYEFKKTNSVEYFTIEGDKSIIVEDFFDDSADIYRKIIEIRDFKSNKLLSTIQIGAITSFVVENNAIAVLYYSENSEIVFKVYDLGSMSMLIRSVHEDYKFVKRCIIKEKHVVLIIEKDREVSYQTWNFDCRKKAGVVSSKIEKNSPYKFDCVLANSIVFRSEDGNSLQTWTFGPKE